MRELIDTKLEAIRSDATAHAFRLAHLLPDLADEFETTRTPDEIRACADAVLSRFDDVAGARLRAGRSRIARRASACATRPATRW